MLDDKKESQKTHAQTMLSSFLVPKKKKLINNPMSIDITNERNVGSIINNDNNSRVEKSSTELNSASANTVRKQR